MAEAAIGMAIASALLKLVVNKCADALCKTDSAAGLMAALLGNLEPKLENMKRELKMMDVQLSAVSSDSLRNDLLNIWLEKIKEAAVFADNLLEDISYEQLRKQAESNKVSKLFSCSSHSTSFTFRKEIGSKLSKFESLTAEIYNEAAKIGVKPVKLVKNPAIYQPPPAMSADLREIRENPKTSIFVGRDLEVDSIVRELSCPKDAEVLAVIAMVGMSGVGKTTLARKIYDNETVAKNYKHKAWIFVSQDFNLKRLLDEMLQSLTGVSHNLSNTGAMEKKLQECLQRESYLLVLDDVWNTEHLVWDSIKSSLDKITNGCTASKVLVTTQCSEVALLMGAYLTQRVEVLSKDDAWKLFEGQAFANKSPEQVSDLRDIGKSILNKCGRLPLSINTVASLLASMHEKSQWEKVDKDQVWNSREDHPKIMPWLLLSFNHLPSAEVKQCFAHCSMFRKGGKFGEETLIEWWIAQGFIHPPKKTDSRNMVDIGREHIKSMLDINLLQSVKHTKPQLYTMHDLVHDLALYVSMDSRLIIKDSNDLPEASAGVEHASIYGGHTCNSLLNFPNGKTQSTLRTLICVNATISIDLVAEARFLRQLHLIGCGLKSIPSSIGELKHLRILTLNDNPVEYLPKSICRLYNLQILRLQSCPRLVELPQQVTKLLNLRIIDTTEAVHIPKGMGQLTRLTHLPVVKLKARDGSKITGLGSLLHLTGKVTIKQLENINSKEDAVDAKLVKKEGITDLKLIWTSEGHGGSVCTRHEKVMEGLQPPSNLEFLQVENFRGKRFSPWLSNELYCNKLSHLTLLNCKTCERLPTLGCLPSLKSLFIDGMESVEGIESDFYYTCDERVDTCSSTGMSQRNLFPSLEEFTLLNMLSLKEWVDPSVACVSAFSCLQELSIMNCPSLSRAPTCFHSLKQLTVKEMNSGEPLLKILSHSDNLTSLTIENIHELYRLSEPLLKCPRLRLLSINGCRELFELPATLQSMDCLETLKIRECESLTSLPDTTGLLSLSRLDMKLCEPERFVSISY